MDWIVLEHHIDRLSLDDELDVNGTVTIVSRQRWLTSLLRLLFTIFAVDLLLFLQAVLPVVVLETILAHILQPYAVAALLALTLGGAF